MFLFEFNIARNEWTICPPKWQISFLPARCRAFLKGHWTARLDNYTSEFLINGSNK